MIAAIVFVAAPHPQRIHVDAGQIGVRTQFAVDFCKGVGGHRGMSLVGRQKRAGVHGKADAVAGPLGLPEPIDEPSPGIAQPGAFHQRLDFLPRVAGFMSSLRFSFQSGQNVGIARHVALEVTQLALADDGVGIHPHPHLDRQRRFAESRGLPEGVDLRIGHVLQRRHAHQPQAAGLRAPLEHRGIHRVVLPQCVAQTPTTIHRINHEPKRRAALELRRRRLAQSEEKLQFHASLFAQMGETKPARRVGRIASAIRALIGGCDARNRHEVLGQTSMLDWLQNTRAFGLVVPPRMAVCRMGCGVRSHGLRNAGPPNRRANGRRNTTSTPRSSVLRMSSTAPVTSRYSEPTSTCAEMRSAELGNSVMRVRPKFSPAGGANRPPRRARTGPPV